MKKYMATLLLAGLATFMTWAGPMGFERGMTFDQLKAIDPAIEKIEDNRYIMTTAPQPSSRFKMYIVTIHPEHGLLRLLCLGVDVTTSKFGDQIRSAYNGIKEKLIESYGAPTFQAEFLKAGSLWDDPQYFMMGLIEKDRYHYSNWGEESKPVNAEIDTVYLEIMAFSQTSAIVRLEYDFTGAETLIAAMKPKESF
jgi:hypothetical protein